MWKKKPVPKCGIHNPDITLTLLSGGGLNHSRHRREDRHLRMGRIGIIAGLALVSSAFALNPDSLDWRVGGFVDNGRFQLADTSADGELQNFMGATWKAEYRINDEWSMNADLLWLFWRQKLHDLKLFHVTGIKFDADMRGWMNFNSGMNRAKFGIYDFKYNPDSKDLGEYLLRSTAYPTILESAQGKDKLEYAFNRVLGGEYGIERPLFRAKALLYAEQYRIPVNDVTPAFLAAAGPEYAELQAGVAFDRFWMFGKQMVRDLPPADSAYIASQGLSTKATKIILRGRLDFAGLLGMDPKHVPIVYAEGALLGLKNDSLYYKKMSERMPVMLGIDIPTGPVLDVFNIELEYWKNPYLDRKYYISDASESRSSPLPKIIPDDLKRMPYDRDDWRWSVFLKRGLNKWLDIEARVASDHQRLLIFNGEYVSGEPMTRLTKDYYFLLRVSYHN